MAHERPARVKDPARIATLSSSTIRGFECPELCRLSIAGRARPRWSMLEPGITRMSRHTRRQFVAAAGQTLAGAALARSAWAAPFVPARDPQVVAFAPGGT